jgi:hypothetical protein
VSLTTPQEIHKKLSAILEELSAQGVSRRRIGEETGIPYSTVSKLGAGHAELTPSKAYILSQSRFIKKPPCFLYPDDWQYTDIQKIVKVASAVLNGYQRMVEKTGVDFATPDDLARLIGFYYEEQESDLTAESIEKNIRLLKY